MKKILILMMLLIVLVAVFTACASVETTAPSAGTFQPLPPITRPPYQAKPLDVEFFFATAYKNMSGWQRYPALEESTEASETTETPESTVTPIPSEPPVTTAS